MVPIFAVKMRSRMRRGGSAFWRSADWQVIWAIVYGANHVVMVLLKGFSFLILHLPLYAPQADNYLPMYPHAPYQLLHSVSVS